MTPSDYHVALGIALIIIGVALVFGGIISWRGASQPDPSERDETASCARLLIRFQRQTRIAKTRIAKAIVPPRVIRNEDSSK